MLTGSCLCGAVEYAYDGDITEISLCHCQQCQKAQGGAFAAVSPIDSDKFRILQGELNLQTYRATPDKVRVFCKQCGSPIYSERDDQPEVKRLRIGTLNQDIQPKNVFHKFVASKVAWYDIEDKHPQFSGNMK